MADKKKMSEKADRRYRAKVKVGVDADGKSVFKYASGRTKKELEANKEELKRAYVGGPDKLIERDVRFDVYAAKWYRASKEKKVALSTRKTYERLFNRHLLPAFGARQLRAITAMDLKEFMAEKSDMCRSDVNQMHSILTNMFREACATGVIDRDPSMTLEKDSKEQESRRPLTEEESAVALPLVEEHTYGVIVALLYYTGMRIGEVLGLQWGDIDFKTELIHVRRDLDFKARDTGKVKTEYSIRDIPMPPQLTSFLFPLRGLGSAFVVQTKKGNHFNNSAFYRVWGDIARRIYLANPSVESDLYSTGRKDKNGEMIMERRSVLTPHYFRHNYATILYDAGVDLLVAQKILGHASPKTTLDIYTHLSNRKKVLQEKTARFAFENISKVAERLPE